MPPTDPVLPGGSYSPPSPTAPAQAGGSYAAPSATAPAQAGGSYSAPSATAPAQAGGSHAAPSATTPVLAGGVYEEPNGGTMNVMRLAGSVEIDGEPLAGDFEAGGTSNGRPVHEKRTEGLLPVRMIARTDSSRSPTAIRWRIEIDVAPAPEDGNWNVAYVQSTGDYNDFLTPALVAGWTAVPGLFEPTGTIDSITVAQVPLPLPLPVLPSGTYTPPVPTAPVAPGT